MEPTIQLTVTRYTEINQSIQYLEDKVKELYLKLEEESNKIYNLECKFYLLENNNCS
jgi:flagellar motility protein MotE (MotC chaperone)